MPSIGAILAGRLRYGIPVMGLGVGAAAAVAPIPVAAASMGVVALVGLAVIGRRLPAVFMASVAVILTGYAFFGRSFAYLGYPPLFVGEAVLGLGILSLLMVGSRMRIGLVHALVLTFVLWGVMRTVPFLRVYGVDSIRDGVAWLYAFYALAVAATVQPHHFERVIRWYQRAIPAYLIWVPIAGIAVAALPLPTLPIANVPILSFKGGDAGIHLGAIAAFIFAGLYGSSPGTLRLPVTLLWTFFLGAAGMVAIVNRGGMLAMATSGAALLFARRAGRVVSLMFVVTLSFTVLVAVDPEVEVPGNRPFSVGQVLDNLTSILGESEGAEIGGDLQGTKSFRLRWWSEIVDYTFNGPYFWTGKGFGVNLANDDGFQVTEDESLRSPHNGHFEVLARMGVPGILLWGGLNLAYAWALARAATRAARGGRPEWVPILAWLFVYWAATMVNASFDPYLQGPQGGIWYWSILGLGLAAIHASERPAPWNGREPEDEPPQPAPQSRPVDAWATVAHGLRQP